MKDKIFTIIFWTLVFGFFISGILAGINVYRTATVQRQFYQEYSDVLKLMKEK